MKILILLVLIAALVFGNLPPYGQPGSWLAAMSGAHSWNGSTITLFMALWDGNTGQNYTTVIATNYTFGSFIPNINERIIALTYSPLEVYNASTVALYKYAPRQAPVATGFTCMLPSYASQATAFFFEKTVYALSGNILYSVSQSSSDHTANTPVCELTVLQPLPIWYSPFCSLSITSNRLAYITGSTLVELWANKNGTFTITSQSIPDGMAGTWLWLQEDPVTSIYYYMVTTTSYKTTFWSGERKGKHLNETESVSWNQMAYWKELDPGQFTIDSRNETAFAGPLFCSADSFFDTGCYTVQSQQAWSGPKLKDAFDGDSGAISYQLYDPSCN